MSTLDPLKFVISTLDNDDKKAIFEHLLRLSSADRYKRFFAAVSNTVLERYVFETMDLRVSRGFGIFKDSSLIAFAHISGEERVEQSKRAELGISVDAEYRGNGLARRILDRSITYCRSIDIDTLYMSCLRENEAMQHLAKTCGLRVVIDHSEALAELNYDTFPVSRETNQSHEIAYEQIAIFDKCYRRNPEMIHALLKGQ